MSERCDFSKLKHPLRTYVAAKLVANDERGTLVLLRPDVWPWPTARVEWELVFCSHNKREARLAYEEAEATISAFKRLKGNR